ncbi:uncharacterized protein METZ01_LOCUS402354, partial [marine metagenome]
VTNEKDSLLYPHTLSLDRDEGRVVEEMRHSH